MSQVFRVSGQTISILRFCLCYTTSSIEKSIQQGTYRYVSMSNISRLDPPTTPSSSKLQEPPCLPFLACPFAHSRSCCLSQSPNKANCVRCPFHSRAGRELHHQHRPIFLIPFLFLVGSLLGPSAPPLHSSSPPTSRPLPDPSFYPSPASHIFGTRLNQVCPQSRIHSR